jgi:hypothetical protein
MIKIVYICSPFSGDVARNTENARKFCKYAVSKGVMPIAPHLLFPQFLDDNCPVEREKGLAFGLALLEKADELWVYCEYAPPATQELACVNPQSNTTIMAATFDMRLSLFCVHLAIRT